jgi:transposase-like protein
MVLTVVNKHTFVKTVNRSSEPSILRKIKFTSELITLCLDLYFSGLSLRKVAGNVSDHFNIDLHHSTIYDWIQRYIPKISEYVNSLILQLSNQWHVDELFVKMKGDRTRKGQSGIAISGTSGIENQDS